MKRRKYKKRIEQTVPRKLAERTRRIKKQMREFARDLWLNEQIIIIGLIASGLQLAYAFAYTSLWSWLAAILKAAFVEAAVWSLNRAIAWAATLNLKQRVYGLWALLFVVFFISTRANLQYEYEQKIRAHNPQASVFNSRVVDGLLTWDEKLDAWLRGGLLPIIVFGLILARRTLAAAAEGFEREETARLRIALRGAEYRVRKRRELENLASELHAGDE